MPFASRQFRNVLRRIREIAGSNIDGRRRDELIKRGLVSIGRHTYGAPRIDSYRGSEARVTIGHFCSISRGVVFVTGGIHPPNWCSTFPFRIQFEIPGAFSDGMPMTRGDINVGSDVWIGTDAMILSGLSVGDGSVIAARSVVTGEVPPYAIVGGAPARVISYRFEEREIEKMLQIRWWDWPDEDILDAVPYLSSPDINGFIERFHMNSRESQQSGRNEK